MNYEISKIRYVKIFTKRMLRIKEAQISQTKFTYHNRVDGRHASISNAC